MLNFILLDKSNEEIGELIGWIPDRTKEDAGKDNKGFKRRKSFYNNKSTGTAAEPIHTLTGMFPLKQLFGFLESYNRLLYLMKIKLTLNRNKDTDKKVFYGTKGEAQLEIKSL